MGANNPTFDTDRGQQLAEHDCGRTIRLTPQWNKDNVYCGRCGEWFENE